jgi:hypothetical protein
VEQLCGALWRFLALSALLQSTHNKIVSLNSWLDSDAFLRLRSDVAANIRRARSLQDRAVNHLQVSLKTELAIGMMHSRIALRSGNRKEGSRQTEIARQAYDAIIRLIQRKPRTELQSEQITAELGRLKQALRNLGERV